MSEAEEKAKKAIETCENLQVMIDISAKTLRSLREQLQSNPSSQVSQALREAEVRCLMYCVSPHSHGLPNYVTVF